MGAAEAADYVVPLSIAFSLAAAVSAAWAFKSRKPVAIGLTVVLLLAAVFMFTR